jgi:hypothetical protein
MQLFVSSANAQLSGITRVCRCGRHFDVCASQARGVSPTRAPEAAPDRQMNLQMNLF